MFPPQPKSNYLCPTGKESFPKNSTKTGSILTSELLDVPQRSLNSRTGRAWRSLREDPLAAEVMGMPVNWLKLMASPPARPSRR